MKKKSKKQSVAPEWSVLFDALEMPRDRVKLSLSPGPAERKKLAKRLELLSLDALKADLVINRAQGGRVFHVAGDILANVTQRCSLTAVPVKSKVRDSFEAWYTDPEQAVSLSKARRERTIAKGNQEVPILDEAEDPEPLSDGKIDLGETIVQFLSLAIDPYPHAKGAKLPPLNKKKKGQEEADQAFRNPFAGLKDWKAKLK